MNGDTSASLLFVKPMSIAALHTRVELQAATAVSLRLFTEPHEQLGAVSSGSMIFIGDQVVYMEEPAIDERFANLIAGDCNDPSPVFEKREYIAPCLLLAYTRAEALGRIGRA